MTFGTSVDRSLPHWDLSSIYRGLESAEFEDAVDELEGQLAQLDRYLTENDVRRGAAGRATASVVSVIHGYLDRTNTLTRLNVTLRNYVWAIVTTDSYNEPAKRWYTQLERLGVALEQCGVRFQGWLGEHAAALDEAIAADPVLREHDFFLHETAEQSRYLMSEVEESLAAELAPSGRYAWSRLQGTVVSQLTVPFEHEGLTEDLPITAVLNLARDPDADLRRRAYEAELAAWESVREPLAAALNGVTGAAVTVARRRGRADVLAEAVDRSRIDRATLDVMTDAIQDSLPSLRRYFRRKAHRLGHDALPWWDLFAPPPGTGRSYSFEESRELLLEPLTRFSPRLGQLARRAFDEWWIDAEPRKGKGAGAYCMSLPSVEESRVFVNFGGQFDDVLSLAHELGHAFHNECQADKTLLQRQTPMTLAETASIFNETILTDAAFQGATESSERLAILEGALTGSSQILVDVTSRFLFEREVFERRTEAELSAEELCDAMSRAQAVVYGDALDARYRHPYMWTWKIHYYLPDASFYNFPYPFGLLFGLGLYARYREAGDAFIPEYERLLADSGEGTAETLAARFGIDLRQREFWRNGLAVIEEQIERYVEL